MAGGPRGAFSCESAAHPHAFDGPFSGGSNPKIGQSTPKKGQKSPFFSVFSEIQAKHGNPGGAKMSIVRFKKSSSLHKGRKKSQKFPALRAHQNTPKYFGIVTPIFEIQSYKGEKKAASPPCSRRRICWESSETSIAAGLGTFFFYRAELGRVTCKTI